MLKVLSVNQAIEQLPVFPCKSGGSKWQHGEMVAVTIMTGIVGKRLKKFTAFLLAAVLTCSLAGCNNAEKKADADVLMREASTTANEIQNCSASVNSTLEFTANTQQYAFKTKNDIVYWAKPFALKSTQSTLAGGRTSTCTTYTVTDDKGVWFYSNAGGSWQKTSAGNVDTTPLSQIDILRILANVKAQKYVRETTLDSKTVHKLELTFQGEVLRSMLENIVTAAGMGEGSSTIVDTLLDSAPEVYGYCYIDKATGQIVQLELDATKAVNEIFNNIDGSSITVNVSKCNLTGTIANTGKAPAVQLPADAVAASTVEAQG